MIENLISTATVSLEKSKIERYNSKINMKIFEWVVND